MTDTFVLPKLTAQWKQLPDGTRIPIDPDTKQPLDPWTQLQAAIQVEITGLTHKPTTEPEMAEWLGHLQQFYNLVQPTAQSIQGYFSKAYAPVSFGYQLEEQPAFEVVKVAMPTGNGTTAFERAQHKQR